MELPLPLTIYALRSLSTYPHPPVIAITSWVDSSHQFLAVEGFSLLQGVINRSIGKYWQQKTDVGLPKVYSELLDTDTNKDHHPIR